MCGDGFQFARARRIYGENQPVIIAQVAANRRLLRLSPRTETKAGESGTAPRSISMPHPLAQYDRTSVDQQPVGNISHSAHQRRERLPKVKFGIGRR